MSWLDHIAAFFDENFFPGSTTVIWCFVTSCREADADQPAELSVISSDILLCMRGLEEYDPPFRRRVLRRIMERRL